MLLATSRTTHGARRGRLRLRSLSIVIAVSVTACGASGPPQATRAPESAAVPPAPAAPAGEPEAQGPQAPAELQVLAPSPISSDNVLTAELGSPLQSVDLRRHAEPFIARLRRVQRSARRRAGESLLLGAAGGQGLVGVGRGGGGESVTNNQEAGVDEGGIVKAWRNHLVVMRRGRLWTASLGSRAGAAQAVAMIDLQPSNRDHNVWYDEMLIHQASGTVIVTGYSYRERATQLAFFAVRQDGSLRRGAVHHVRANDYYSSRNYASRLIGNELVFYSPHQLVEGIYRRARLSLPKVRSGNGPWRPLLPGNRALRLPGTDHATTVHMVVRCTFSTADLDCRATGLLGSPQRTSYVTQDAVYLWVQPSEEEWHYEVFGDQEHAQCGSPYGEQPCYLVRMPLARGGQVQALAVAGSPIDQFSFSERDDTLSVHLRGYGGGDGMWGAEAPAPPVPGLEESEQRPASRMLRLPLSAFGANVRTVSESAYRALPRPRRSRSALHNRFVGGYLLYGTGTSWRGRDPINDDRVFLHRQATGENYTLSLSGGIDRIEALGEDAIVIGTDGENLHFQALALSATPRVAGHFRQAGARQGETRSHGFFFKPSGPQAGTLGLPMVSQGGTTAAQLRNGSAEVVFLGVASLDFTPLGTLSASTTPPQRNDRCEVSCVDWYGNARPLFYRGRVYALLGYELVEGGLQDDTIQEVARTNLLDAMPEPPPASPNARRGAAPQ